MAKSWVDRQLERDSRVLKGQPALLARKWQRMAASPFAFLRGAAPFWASLMQTHQRTLKALGGRGILVGDLHLENFGTSQTARGLLFHVNDFDETFEGPWAFDVLRLLTSVLLARPQLGVSGTTVLTLAEEVLEGHAAGLRGSRGAPPQTIAGFIKTERELSLTRWLAKRVTADGKRLVLVPDKTLPVTQRVHRAVQATLDACRPQNAWFKALGPRALEVRHVARRVMGTGSLGVERLLVLTRGDKTPLLFDVKEVRGSPADPRPPSAERLVAALHRALPEPPVGVCAAHLVKTPVVVAPLAPGVEKLSVDEYQREDAEGLCRTLGRLTGDLHRRGASQSTRWSANHARTLLHLAQHLAGEHELAFLEFCERVRR